MTIRRSGCSSAMAALRWRTCSSTSPAAAAMRRRRGDEGYKAKGRCAPDTDQAMTSASLSRIGAMVRRYWYLLRSSWPRILDLIYWPTVQMLMWGFLQTYVASLAGFFARAGGVFIGAVLLWDILFRVL